MIVLINSINFEEALALERARGSKEISYHYALDGVPVTSWKTVNSLSPSSEEEKLVATIYKIMTQRARGSKVGLTEADKRMQAAPYVSKFFELVNGATTEEKPVTDPVETTPKEAPEGEPSLGYTYTPIPKDAGEAMQKFINFFAPYQNEKVSIRFADTFARINTLKGHKKATEYAINRFKIIGSGKVDELIEATKSQEWEWIVTHPLFNRIPKGEPVNSRLVIFFGDPGTGKTTVAKGLCKENYMQLNSDTEANDLVRQVTVHDGVTDIDDTPLVKAVENGFPITLDEMNLARADVMTKLQELTDNRQFFQNPNNGHLMPIKEGFMIYGTLNLTIGDVVRGIPVALADRAADIVEFKLSADKMAKMLD